MPWFRLSRCKIQQNCKVQRNVRDKQLIKVAYRGTFLICVWMTTILCCQTELRVGISVYLPLTVKSNLTLQGLKITTLRSVKACIPFMCSTKYLALLLDLLFRRKSLGTVHRWPVAPAGDSSEELCCWHRGEGCKRALALVSHPLLTVELCSQDGFQARTESDPRWMLTQLPASCYLGRALQWIVRGYASELCKCYVTHTLEKETLSIHLRLKGLSP